MHRMLLVVACLAALCAAACSSHQPQPFMVELPDAMTDQPPDQIGTESPEPQPEPAPDPVFSTRPVLSLDMDLGQEAPQGGMESVFSAQERTINDFLTQHPEARIMVAAFEPGQGDMAEIMAASRAQAARDFLVWRYGLDPDRVLARAEPGSAPAVSRLELNFFDPGAGPTAPGQAAGFQLDLHFGTGQSALSGEQYAQLEALGRFMAAHPGVMAMVTGHTDSVGSQETNLRLSQERAASVRQELIQRFGVDPDCIASQGLGESMPVASNDTDQGRLANRRVSISLSGADLPDPDQALASLVPDLPPLSPDAEYMVEISVTQCRLWLYETAPGQEPRLVRTFSVATPRTDMPAPLGWGEVTRIDFNPSWSPTANMQRRAQARGQSLPDYVAPGSPANPMGTFKLHLSHGYGFRIHGTNAPNSIGTRASSGCIRMNNEEGHAMAAVLHVGTPVHIVQ